MTDKAIQDQICDLSDGNPGAINVMCQGVALKGSVFLDALVLAGVRGSEVWRIYKDECGMSLEGTFDALVRRSIDKHSATERSEL